MAFVRRASLRKLYSSNFAALKHLIRAMLNRSWIYHGVSQWAAVCDDELLGTARNMELVWLRCCLIVVKGVIT
jgi:hypothetical protein